MNVDEEAVQAVLDAKTHYEILCVEFTANEKDIKKKYKQLALAVHPDKNGAIKADDAFKLLRSAFECLSDPIKRRDYDRTIAASSRKRPHKAETETPEERKKRKEEEIEKNRAMADAYCEAASERMDNRRSSWQQWQNKAWTKKKK